MYVMRVGDHWIGGSAGEPRLVEDPLDATPMTVGQAARCIAAAADPGSVTSRMNITLVPAALRDEAWNAALREATR